MRHKKVLAFSGIVLGMMSSVLMQTIIATVLPIAARDMGDMDLYGWVFSSYMISSTISIPLFSKLADLFGRKPLYLFGLTLFLIGSSLSGSVHSMGQLIASRILQGLGAGAVAPAALALISDLFPIDERGKWLGFMAAAQVLANVTGPLVGGIIADYWGWKWAFYANLPVGLLALTMVGVGLDRNVSHFNVSWRSLDIVGGLLLGILTVLIILGSQEFGKVTLVSWQSVLYILSSVALLGILLWQEKRHPDPIISSHLLRAMNLKPALLIAFLFGVLMYGIIMILPLYGQFTFGVSAWQGGKLLIPLTLGLGSGGILISPLSKKFKDVHLMKCGWIVAFCGFVLLWVDSQISLPYSFLLIVIFITGLGLGVIFPVIILISQNSALENQRAVTGGLVQMGRNMGGAIGVPVFTSLIMSKGAYGSITAKSAFAAVYISLILGAWVALIIGFLFKGEINKNRRKQGHIE